MSQEAEQDTLRISRADPIPTNKLIRVPLQDPAPSGGDGFMLTASAAINHCSENGHQKINGTASLLAPIPSSAVLSPASNKVAPLPEQLDVKGEANDVRPVSPREADDEDLALLAAAVGPRDGAASPVPRDGKGS